MVSISAFHELPCNLAGLLMCQDKDALAPGGLAENHCLLLYPILWPGVVTLRWGTAVEAGNRSTYNHS